MDKKAVLMNAALGDAKIASREELEDCRIFKAYHVLPQKLPKILQSGTFLSQEESNTPYSLMVPSKEKKTRQIGRPWSLSYRTTSYDSMVKD
ncbi:hypothetical protein TNCV_3966261 [Trichonephila clavipes]|nr:hypothetical protein TNCV_3966261 [Trichonephila clavipes]